MTFSIKKYNYKWRMKKEIRIRPLVGKKNHYPPNLLTFQPES